MSTFDELAQRLRTLVHEEAEAVAPKVERWTVVTGDPLVIEQIEGDLVLEEGDPDVEIDRALLVEGNRPSAGDTVRVHFDGEDWIVAGVVT